MSRLVEIGKFVAGEEARVPREPIMGVFLLLLALSSVLAMVSCASPYLEAEPTPLSPTEPSTLAQFQDLDERAVGVEWEGTGQTPSPYVSKIDATLDLLLTLRGKDEIPEEMREITKRDTVSVSINFSHELNASEIRSLEEQGVRFIRLGDEVAHSGTIYGADVPWEKIEDLTEVASVVRVESAWQPELHSPAN